MDPARRLASATRAALLLLAAHCAAPAPDVAPPRPPPPASVPAKPPAAAPQATAPQATAPQATAPQATAPQAAAPPARASRPPLPPLDSQELKDKLAFVSTVCRAAVKHDRAGSLHVGCTTCPPFESEEEKPNGEVDVDPEMFYDLNVLLLGSFTKPGADEASATFDGCESHAENYGGTLIAERRGSGWLATRYDSGVHPDDCKPFRRKDGRDILVCKWGDGHQSYWHEMVFSYDFTRSTPDDVAAGWDEIVTMNDDATAGCYGTMPGAAVESGRVDDFKLKDVNRDGTLDLVVTVSVARSLPTKAYKDKCAELLAEMEKAEPAPVDVAVALGKRRSHELHFVYDGRIFAPTPRTAQQMKSL